MELSFPLLPDKARIYAIGDIHGRADSLLQLLKQIGEDARSHPDEKSEIVCLGDFVDRGPHVREVIDTLLSYPLQEFNKIFLKGNHEDMMLSFLQDWREGPLWFLNGGWATLQSYLGNQSVLVEQSLSSLQEKLKAQLPSNHLEFLRQLKLYYEKGDYLFVHAGVRPGVPLVEQKVHDLLWIREPFLDSRENFGKIVVHGHTVSAQPDVKFNQIGIDTGAVYTGVLTALVLSSTEPPYFLQTN